MYVGLMIWIDQKCQSGLMMILNSMFLFSTSSSINLNKHRRTCMGGGVLSGGDFVGCGEFEVGEEGETEDCVEELNLEIFLVDVPAI